MLGAIATHTSCAYNLVPPRWQDLYHEGSLVASGIKYTLRTEAMYTRRPIPEEQPPKGRGDSESVDEEGYETPDLC